METRKLKTEWPADFMQQMRIFHAEESSVENRFKFDDSMLEQGHSSYAILLTTPLMKKCYIAGKIGGLELQEVESNFSTARDLVRSLGLEPVCPRELKHDHDKTWLSFMREDLTALLTCDYVYGQPNWRDSRGACVEISLACDLGIPVIDYHYLTSYVDSDYITTKALEYYLEGTDQVTLQNLILNTATAKLLSLQ